MSNYQLTPITNTETALNCDVTCDEQYLGRLYVFPTNDPELRALGIEKEWFLAHELGDFVVSGHVNAVGEWCVSPHRSLEPSLEFISKAEVFDRVFSPDYEREVLAVREILSKEMLAQEMLAKEMLAQEMLAQEMLTKETLSQETVSSISYLDSLNLVSGSDSGGEDEDSSNPIVEPILATLNEELSIPNLEVLKELLRRSSEEELEEITEAVARQSDELELVTKVNAEIIQSVAQQPDKSELLTEVNTEIIQSVAQQSDELEETTDVSGEAIVLPLMSDVVQKEESLRVDEEVDQKFWELQIVEVQEALIDRVVEEYQERETTEFVLPPFGLVTVHVEEEYFVLNSAQDGHTVMEATLEGDVLKELDESDAVEFEEIFKRSQIEVSRFESLPGEELRDSVQASEMDTKEDDPANRTGKGKKSKGIEYGD